MHFWCKTFNITFLSISIILINQNSASQDFLSSWKEKKKIKRVQLNLWNWRIYFNVANSMNTYYGMLLFSGMLLKQEYSAGLRILMSYVALKLGSSKQGKACLACVVWNCVAASHLHLKKTHNIRNSTHSCNISKTKNNITFLSNLDLTFPKFL